MAQIPYTGQPRHAFERVVRSIAVYSLRGLIIAVLGSITLMARIKPEPFMLGKDK